VEPGPFIQTVSGRRFNPLEPDPAEIDIVDIAYSLANQCRFGGHVRSFYSIAQHSCHVADVVAEREPDAALWALLHDAAEAYLGDMPHPLKHRSELGVGYARVEGPLQEAICERFGLPRLPPPIVKQVDLATERRDVASVAWHWPELDGFEPLDGEIEPWLPDRAREEFLERYERLSGAGSGRTGTRSDPSRRGSRA
jgi:uncharacterized protein